MFDWDESWDYDPRVDACLREALENQWIMQDYAFSLALARYDSCINDADQQMALIFLNVGHYDD
jgi:hypothetical protein